MNVSLMNLRITFQKNTVVTDAIGNHKNAWTDCFSCFATISGESGAESEKAGETVPTENAAFTVRWCAETAAVTTDGYRIVSGSELYNITSIDHMNNRHKALKFHVERVRR